MEWLIIVGFIVFFAGLVLLAIGTVKDDLFRIVMGVVWSISGGTIAVFSVPEEDVKPKSEVQECIDTGGRPVVLLNDDLEIIIMEECRA